MSFGIALSGLNAAQSDLNTTANNIANSDTTGFKSSTAQFAELFATSPQGVSNTQIGNGVQLQQVEQQFSQGDIQTTGNSLDLALSGNGFFTVAANGADQYTRAGSFQTNANGEVVNAAGQNLQVYPPTTAGAFNTTTLQNLVIPTGDSAPASDHRRRNAEPAGRDTPPTVAPFDPTNANTYNESTSMTLYDSLGAAHTASIYFVNTGAGKWDAYEYIDGTGARSMPASPCSCPTATAARSPAWWTLPAASTRPLRASAPIAATGAAAMNITFNFSGTTQYGDSFGVTDRHAERLHDWPDQRRHRSVRRASCRRTTPTVSRLNLGQVAVANFASQEGLQQVNDTNWVQTAASGAAVYGQAGGPGVGLLQSGSLEASNVDITAQLVNMITAQRAFQANSEMVSTENAITQTVINIPNQQ